MRYPSKDFYDRFLEEKNLEEQKLKKITGKDLESNIAREIAEDQEPGDIEISKGIIEAFAGPDLIIGIRETIMKILKKAGYKVVK